MADEQTVIPSSEKWKFPVGHPRFGGRKRNSTRRARELAEELGIDPLEFLLRLVNEPVTQIAKTDSTGEVLFDDQGKPVLVWTAVPLDVRIECAKITSRFIHPSLQAVAIGGEDGGPVPVAQTTLDLTAIMAKPELFKAAQELAFYLIQPEQEGAAQRQALEQPQE